jgi:anti-sigma factor RsiW
MKHVSYEEWLKYVEDELDEEARERYEEHLYSCDHCMEIYLTALETGGTSFPEISDEARFTESVIEEVQQYKEQGEPSTAKTQRFYQKAAFHYIIAAAMTIVLMYTGVFQQLIGFAEEFERSSHPSITNELMNKTADFINEVENQTREEGN